MESGFAGFWGLKGFIEFWCGRIDEGSYLLPSKVPASPKLGNLMQKATKQPLLQSDERTNGDLPNSSSASRGRTGVGKARNVAGPREGSKVQESLSSSGLHLLNLSLPSPNQPALSLAFSQGGWRCKLGSAHGCRTAGVGVPWDPSVPFVIACRLEVMDLRYSRLAADA